MKVLEKLILILSNDEAQCLDVRRIQFHRRVMGESFYNFVYQFKDKFYWGLSVNHGFSCFNELQDSKQCADFEYRIWKQCDFTKLDQLSVINLNDT